MYFRNETGGSLFEDLEAKIKAFKELKNANISINTFHDNAYWKLSCVDVIRELEWLKYLVDRYSGKEYLTDQPINSTLVSGSERLLRGFYDPLCSNNENLKRPLRDYLELNSAILDRMHWIIDKAMSKKREIQIPIQVPVSESIDKNTLWTIISIFYGGAIASLIATTESFKWVFLSHDKLVFGGFVVSLVLLILTVFLKRKELFKKIEKTIKNK